MLAELIDKDKDSWASHPDVVGGWPLATFTVRRDWSVGVEQGWFVCPFGNVAQFLLHPTGGSGDGESVGWYELDYGWGVGGPNGITLEVHSVA